ncbi:ABC transporter permease [Saccharomonospora viridis]|uniref:ABC-2 type transport system permease protein n=2 Tax=Saccharomonospora viridis TaxID=1852 RepID=C7N0B2_SACVD|nr:hypothetical protein [Saccharomonospora viridis]ACU98314.1 hypothetical protein Svir_33500 [Saccharomonospora viridis DSM 43017]KHF44107.1 hypothetical protein MINT15_09890 [Saccharomonospora viridis]SFP56672.1 ABC-2 type transport system permease protein [Saccharomonospora viridis]
MSERVPELELGVSPTAGWRESVGHGFRVRTRAPGFVVGVATALAALIGYVGLHGWLATPTSDGVTIGLIGQATAIGDSLRAVASELDAEVTVIPYRDPERARREVADGRLDVLVSGSTSDLRVLSGSSVDPFVRAVLTGISRDVVLEAKLAEIGLDPTDVRRELDATDVRVTVSESVSHRHRPVLAMVLSFAVFTAIATHGTHAARRVVTWASEQCAAPGRQALFGMLGGVGLAGLVQFAAVGVVSVGALSVAGVPGDVGVDVLAEALSWGLLCYTLGFALYSTVLTTVWLRRDAGPRPHPLSAMPWLLGAFTVSVVVLRLPGNATSTVLSSLPLLSPTSLPGRIVTDIVSPAEVTAAILLLAATVVVSLWLLDKTRRPKPHPYIELGG